MYAFVLVIYCCVTNYFLKHQKLSSLKAAKIYLLTVCVGQESLRGLAGYPWLKAPHEVAVVLLIKAVSHLKAQKGKGGG